MGDGSGDDQTLGLGQRGHGRLLGRVAPGHVAGASTTPSPAGAPVGASGARALIPHRHQQCLPGPESPGEQPASRPRLRALRPSDACLAGGVQLREPVHGAHRRQRGPVRRTSASPAPAPVLGDQSLVRASAQIAVGPGGAHARPACAALAKSAVALFDFCAIALVRSPPGKPLEELAEGVHLIVIPTPGEGQQLGFEVVEPCRLLGQEHIARLELGRVPFEPGDLVDPGLVADRE